LKGGNQLDNPIEIRPAEASDVDDIHALIVHLAESTGHAGKITSTPADFLRSGFSEPVAYQALIAEHLDQVIGLALFFYTFSSWRGEPGVYVQDLVVAEQARGSGLGRRLIEATARVALGKGATHLRLSVAADNDIAVRFYDHLGLVASDGERIFEADGLAFARLAENR
jgi:GNAT superfamily N-acetyltransferase